MCVRGGIASALLERVGFHFGEGIGNPGVSQANAWHAYSCTKSTHLNGEIAGRVAKSITHEDIATHGASIAALTRFVCHQQNPLCTAAQTERRFTDDANEEQPEEGPNAETEEEGRDEM